MIEEISEENGINNRKRRTVKEKFMGFQVLHKMIDLHVTCINTPIYFI